MIRKLLAAGLVLGAMPVLAQTTPDIVKLRIEAPAAVAAGEQGRFRLIFDVRPAWHMYAPTGKNAGQGLIELNVKFTPHKNVQVTVPQYPVPVAYGPNDVYRGSAVAVTQRFRVRPQTPAGKYVLKGKLTYQVCKAELCLPPYVRNVDVVVAVKR